MNGIPSLIAAICLMSIAHFIRVLRWELFVKVYEKPDRKRLLGALSIGYLINYVVPYKLGDIVKGFFAGHRMKSGKALGLSTVIVDRYLDVFAVGLIFGILSITGRGNADLVKTSKFYVIVFGLLVVFTVIIYLLRRLLKKGIRLFSSLFNTRLEVSVLSFAWALIWNFKDIFLKINKLKLILYTVLMWGIYILSYWFFAGCYFAPDSGSGWIDIFSLLFGESGVKASTIMLSFFRGDFDIASVYMIIYMLSPLAILLLVSLILKRKTDGEKSSETYLNLLPQLNAEEKLVFLDIYFSGKSKEYIDNYLKINHSISVVRDYSAGSNATTILAVDDRGMFFRKYAFGASGDKLNEQIEWIRENSDILPLPEILFSETNEMYCYYDMPYDPNAVGMFEFVHSMPSEKSFDIIKRILEKLDETIYRKDTHPADDEHIAKYIESKVFKNLHTIAESKRLRPLLEYDTLVINGTEYRNLPFYEKWLSKEYLTKIFSGDEYAVIHGDLTIENIVCKGARDGEYDYYLIDPNTGNVHDSPLLDIAKLFQSIHGGYEFLMAVKNVTVTDNHINFIFTKSFAYSDLFERVSEYIEGKYKREQVISIFFHEIVHWLRLMPYKLEKDPRTAPAFYAGMLMVMDDVWKRFLADEK